MFVVARLLLAFSAYLVSLSCSSQAVAPSGFSSLPRTENTSVLELRIAFVGGVENCPSCVLLEIPEGNKRNAYYVRPEPECLIRLSDMEMGSFEDDGYEVSITFRLTPHVSQRMDSCLQVQLNTSLYEVIATINGEFVGRGLYLKESSSLTLYGGEFLRRLDARRRKLTI